MRVCEAREQPPVFAPKVPPSLTLAWNLAKLAGQQTPGECLHLQNAGLWVCATFPDTYYVGSGAQPQVFLSVQ